MARKKKPAAARVAAERRRRDSATARLSAVREDNRLADVRRLLREGADRAAFARRLDAAMAITEEFTWQPWGYEIAPPEPMHGRGLSVRHLRVVVDNPAPRARDRFATPVATPRDRALAVMAA